VTPFRCYTIGCLRTATKVFKGVHVCDRCYEELTGEYVTFGQLFRPLVDRLRKLTPAARRERRADKAGRDAVARTMADTAPDPDLYLDARDVER
jgi:hypothetical protein